MPMFSQDLLYLGEEIQQWHLNGAVRFAFKRYRGTGKLA